MNNNNRNSNSVLKEIQSALSKVSIQGGRDWGILHKDTTTKNNHLEV
ncbi:MAG TPA: hypothetical protein VEQ18_03855 [Candidatus Nitrosocosmicus sp.]|nr:hypothetical protein [Candidatus Nitrosocosmicus sp.]